MSVGVQPYTPSLFDPPVIGTGGESAYPTKSGSSTTAAVVAPVVSPPVVTAPDTIDLSSPSLSDVEKAVEALEALMETPMYCRQKIKVFFKQPTEVVVKRRYTKVSEMEATFFKGDGSGSLCYSLTSRLRGGCTGYPMSYSQCANICRLSIRHGSDIFREKIARVQALGRSIHPNAWDDLRKKIEQTPDEYLQYGLSTMSMTERFDEYVIRALKESFEHKTKYSYRTDRLRRHWSVETKLCDDGIFRAWFSSEYSGCANGGYYLLLNPTTASFCEYD